MRAAWLLLPALAALSAYYVYLPLPGAVSDPWKLMLLDATFRAVQQTVRRPRTPGWGGGRAAPAPVPEAVGSAVMVRVRGIRAAERPPHSVPGPAPRAALWLGSARVGDIACAAGWSWAGPAAPGDPACRRGSGLVSLCDCDSGSAAQDSPGCRLCPSVRPSVRRAPLGTAGCQRCPGLPAQPHRLRLGLVCELPALGQGKRISGFNLIPVS